MRPRKVLSMVLVCLLFAGTATPAHAAEVETFTLLTVSASTVTPCGTNFFTVTVPAKSSAATNTAISLSAGETVTIKASYAPTSAKVDFGLVAPSGTYYYFTATGGSIDKTMEVSENGSYTLKIRNNASTSVKVTRSIEC